MTQLEINVITFLTRELLAGRASGKLPTSDELAKAACDEFDLWVESDLNYPAVSPRACPLWVLRAAQETIEASETRAVE